MRKVKCPRSTLRNAYINDTCKLNECPFYSPKMLLNCTLIHKNTYFKKSEETPTRLLEIKCGLSSSEYNRLIDLSLYLSRMYLILVKYNMDYIGSIGLRFRSKDIKTWLQQSNVDLCSSCNTVLEDNKCRCLDNPVLMKERINFHQNWVSSITKNEVPEDISELSFPELYIRFGKMDDIKAIRGLLNTISLDQLKITDLPFGYVFVIFKTLYEDKEWKMMENLGLTEASYRKANKLFKD